MDDTLNKGFKNLSKEKELKQRVSQKRIKMNFIPTIASAGLFSSDAKISDW